MCEHSFYIYLLSDDGVIRSSPCVSFHVWYDCIIWIVRTVEKCVEELLSRPTNDRNDYDLLSSFIKRHLIKLISSL